MVQDRGMTSQTPRRWARQDTAFATAWQQWREQREARLADPHGFLAVTGLHWLMPQPQRFSDVPGEWCSGPEGVVVTLTDGEVLEIDGELRTGRVVVGPVDEAGIRAGFGDAVVEIAERFGSAILRPRHPDNPARLTYRGTPTFDPDPAWVLPGRFEAYAVPKSTGVDTVVEGMEGVYEALGEVVFEADGRPQRLVAFDGGEGDLWIIFTDETSGETTYAAARQLSVAPPGPDGRVLLDFNRAVNLPCAYSDFATCPLPPTGNHVDVLVEAGEKTPPKG
jgi:uncharacterized protein (DUF1684 family)